jgi:hypothetical protein
MDSGEPALQQAIATIAQSDPLIKLLQQVQQGRMKPTDAGLRAVIESWLATYRKVVATKGLSRQALVRIDPTPRISVLIEKGIVTFDHPAVVVLHREFTEAIALARE